MIIVFITTTQSSLSQPKLMRFLKSQQFSLQVNLDQIN